MMVYVDTIWFSAGFTKPDSMRIKVRISGMEKTLDVPLPPQLKVTVEQIAQNAADAFELQLKAEMLAEKEIVE